MGAEVETVNNSAYVPRTCALAKCNEPTADLVAHPGRNEPQTALCAHHAEIARDELGVEVAESL
jgi:hypothetical protein